MKPYQYISAALILFSLLPLAAQSDKPSFNVDQFKEKQRTYLIKKVQLSDSEAALFFPIYEELQHKKHTLFRESRKMSHDKKEDKLTDSECRKIVELQLDNNIKTAELEKEYYAKFRKVLSDKQLFMLQRAEAYFQREMLKGIGENKKMRDKPRK